MRKRKPNWETIRNTAAGLTVLFLLLPSGCDTTGPDASLSSSAARSSRAISTSIAGIADSSPDSGQFAVQIPVDQPPVVLKPTTAIGYPVSRELLWANQERLAMKADRRYTASRWLHFMRALGADVTQKFEGRTVTGLELFTDAALSERYFGAPVFGQTRFGIRYRSSGDGEIALRTMEVHRDQCLAVLAELYCPLTTELTVEGRKFQLVDALRDSIANFHLEQNELAWSGLAYSLYLAPNRQWTNKFGEQFTFDDVVLKLLDQNLDYKACVGMHVVSALSAIHRIDTEHSPLLSGEVRRKLQLKLQFWLDAASQSQSSDGSWDADWYQEKSDRVDTGAPMIDDELKNRLLATSHLVEWIMFAPEELEFDSERLRLAGRWLDRTLQNLPEKMVWEHFCPVSHGTSSLELLSNMEHETLLE